MDVKKVESQFQLLSSLIVSLNVNNTFLIYDERKPGDKKIDVSYEIKHTESLCEQNRQYGVLDLIIELSSAIEDDQYNLSAVIRGFFNAPLEMSQENFIEMLKINGCAALYSVARGIIGCISSQTFSMGNIVMPMVNFVQFHELEKIQEE